MYKDKTGRDVYTDYKSLVYPEDTPASVSTPKSSVCSSTSDPNDKVISVCATEMYQNSGKNILIFGVSGIKQQVTDYEADATHISRLDIFRTYSSALDTLLVF